MKSVIKLIIILLTISTVSAQSLKITHPNGGEKFTAHSDTMITWEGCAAEDEVTLEYSTNGGRKWDLITESATHFLYVWRAIPFLSSNNCLIRASLNDSTADDVIILGLGSLRQVIYSPDGTKLASCGGCGIFIWDVASGDTILSITENIANILCIAYSPDGKRLACGSAKKGIRIWDIETGSEMAPIIGHVSSIYSLCYSPDGSQLASGGDMYEESIKIWDTQSGVEIRKLKGHTDQINCLCFSSDGSRLASGSDDYSVKIWDVNTGSDIKTLNGHLGYVRDVCFSPEDRSLASIGGTEIKIWDSETWEVTKTIADACSSIDYHPNGTSFAGVGRDSTIKIWDTETGNEVLTLFGHEGNVLTVDFSPDGTMLASSSDDKIIKIWDINTGATKKTSEDIPTWFIVLNSARTEGVSPSGVITKL